jgi:cytochrome c
MKHVPTLLLAGLVTLTLTVPATASEALAKAAGCTTCHAKDTKLIGPSYKEVAARYKGDAKAPALLAERVRKGSKGVWGSLPMPPADPAKVSDADLKAIVAWLLKS